MQVSGCLHRTVPHCWRESKMSILQLIFRGHGSKIRWRAATCFISSAFCLFSWLYTLRTRHLRVPPMQLFCSLQIASLRGLQVVVGRQSVDRDGKARWRMAEAGSSCVLAPLPLVLRGASASVSEPC